METFKQIKRGCFLFYVEKYNELSSQKRAYAVEINSSRKLCKLRHSFGDVLLVDTSIGDLSISQKSLDISLIKKRFAISVWLDLGCYIKELMKLYKLNSDTSLKLEQFWDEEIYPLSNLHYYNYFDREVSLQEKVKPEAYSFDIGIYPPINATFLI